MIDEVLAGAPSLAEIGRRHGLSRERPRQVLGELAKRSEYVADLVKRLMYLNELAEEQLVPFEKRWVNVQKRWDDVGVALVRIVVPDDIREEVLELVRQKVDAWVEEQREKTAEELRDVADDVR